MNYDCKVAEHSPKLFFQISRQRWHLLDEFQSKTLTAYRRQRPLICNIVQAMTSIGLRVLFSGL